MHAITATVTRGPHKGTVMKPHRFSGGYFLVSKGSNLRRDAQQVFLESDLSSWVQSGYGVRLSAPGLPASLFMPKSLVSHAASVQG